MNTNNDTRSDEQLWTEVLEVLQDNRHELTDEEVEVITGRKQETAPDNPGKMRRLSYYKAAAAFFAAAFLGGLAWAISGPLLTSPKGEEPQPTQETSNPLPLGGGREGASSLNFNGLRLDSILAIVAAHYEREVCFRDEAQCSLRFYTTWNSLLPLDSFLTTLNEFDGLRLSDERDTIFVGRDPLPASPQGGE